MSPEVLGEVKSTPLNSRFRTPVHSFLLPPPSHAVAKAPCSAGIPPQINRDEPTELNLWPHFDGTSVPSTASNPQPSNSNPYLLATTPSHQQQQDPVESKQPSGGDDHGHHFGFFGNSFGEVSRGTLLPPELQLPRGTVLPPERTDDRRTTRSISPISSPTLTLVRPDPVEGQTVSPVPARVPTSVRQNHSGVSVRHGPVLGQTISSGFVRAHTSVRQNHSGFSVCPGSTVG